MSCNWPLKRISEVANFENNKRVPLKSLDREKRQGDYPYYGASGIVDYIDDFIFDGNYLLISEDGENLRTRNTPIAFQAKGKFWVNNHAHIFSEKEDGILDYLEYYFSVLNIGAYITGAVQPKLNKANLDKIEIPIPPLEERLKLNGVLNSFRDKSRLNRRINQTLEEMAQAVFKSWFVDFDPVKAKMNGEQPEGMDAATASLFPEKLVESELGLIPEGWESKQLKDVLELAYGKALKKTDRVAGDVPVYGSGGLTGYHNQSLVEGPGIIVGRKGTVGSVYWEPRAFYPIDTVFYVKPRAGYSLKYCHLVLQNLGLKNMNTDAAVPGLNRNNAYRLDVVTPSEAVLDKFEEIMQSFQSKVDANNAQNSNLESLRDTILPKLLSGEVEL
ncbi:restriction endonuclease subunit S [Vibrio splendidus]|uniref:restriction endonuclease subunit S n=1 Tax=Vibrio splendidus TaxID=29497 RepID=UPI000C866EBC|nr:restriction endonuclease subunit S [Vibrio splendidus]